MCSVQEVSSLLRVFPRNVSLDDFSPHSQKPWQKVKQEKEPLASSVQRCKMTKWVETLHEENQSSSGDWLSFSYGFRPTLNKSQSCSWPSLVCLLSKHTQTEDQGSVVGFQRASVTQGQSFPIIQLGPSLHKKWPVGWPASHLRFSDHHPKPDYSAYPPTHSVLELTPKCAWSWSRTLRVSAQFPSTITHAIPARSNSAAQHTKKSGTTVSDRTEYDFYSDTDLKNESNWNTSIYLMHHSGVSREAESVKHLISLYLSIERDVF